MGLEIAWKEFKGAFDGRAGHGDQIAKPFAFVKGKYLAALFQYGLAALALLRLFQQHRESIGFHTAGGALAARFRSEELGNLQNLFDNAGAFGDQANDPAAERGTRVAH